MWIKKIKLYNIGAYEGEHVYEFDTQKHINIILGENGNGKTTLLNSIICCLFGSQMFGSDQITEQYKEYIVNLKNRNTKDEKFYIQMEFNHVNDTYKIKRSFEIVEENIVEEIIIYENDILKKDFKMNTILSQNLIKLFFFNGETILELINNNKIEKYLNNLIVQAYEIDVFLQIEKDLKQKEKREYKEHSSIQYKYNKKEYEKNKKEAVNTKEIIKREEKEYELILNNIDKIKKEIKKRGLLKEEQINELIVKEDGIKKEIKEIKSELDIILNKDINYLLHLKTLTETVNSLNESRNSRFEEIKKTYEKMDEKEDINLNGTISISLQLEVDLLSKQKQYSKYNYEKVFVLNDKLKSHLNDLNKVKQALSKNQKGFEYINLIDNLNTLEKEKEKLEKSKLYKEKKVKELNKIGDALLEKMQKEEELILTTKLNGNSVLEQEKLENIIREYKKIKLEEIYKSIEEATLDIGKNYIFRKNYLVDKVKITPEEIIIYSLGQEVNLKTFSSGEKQAIIVALILAVISKSSLNLPLVLDTFIARLDASHTNKLLSYFKENVKSQTIFLVTNKEMTKKEYDYICDSVGAVYTLKNDGYKVLMERGYNEN